MRLIKWIVKKTLEAVVFYGTVLICLGIIFKEKRKAKRAQGL